MKVGFLITARMKSTRLPLKLIKKLNGREVIRQLLDRLKLVEGLSNIVICTSTNPQDEILKKIAEEEGVDFFLGSEEDVILRLYEASRKFQLDYAVNITADCPLIAYEYVPITIRQYARTKADLIRSFGLPHGLYLYGIDIEALKKICEIKDTSSTEIWGPYFTDTDLFEVCDLDIPEKHRRNYRLTLDYPEDFAVLEKTYNHFGQDAYKTTVDEIVEYLDDNPKIVEINRKCGKDYQERYEEHNKIKIKRGYLENCAAVRMGRKQ